MRDGKDDDVALQESARKIQGMYRVRMARRRLRELLKAVVERFYDEDSGMYYYYNAKTGESSWFKPTLLGSDEANLSAIYANNTDAVASGGEKVDSPIAVEHVQNPLEANNEESVIKELPGIGVGTPLAQDAPLNEPAADINPSTIPDSRAETPPVPDMSTPVDDETQLNDTSEAFTPEEVALIKEQFQKFDPDNSGSISAEEMMAIMHAFGDTSTLDTIKALIHDVDRDGNGEVSVDEFIMILQMQRGKDSCCPSLELAIMFGPDEIANLKRQFQQLDKDSSGEIDVSELAILINSLGQDVTPAQLREIIDEVDRNKNGTIDFNEFCHIVYNMRNPTQSRTISSNRFATLLHLGVAKGLLKDLGNVMNATGARVMAWWNADKIAEEQRLKAKRERALERQRLLREQCVSQKRQIFQEELARLAEAEKARWAVVPGLQHEILFDGDKENYPNKGQYARVHYTAMFENGQVFEASRKRGGALEFKVGAGHVIQGWDLAIPRMSVGETAKITCAPNLAYGVRGRPPKIPPNATLVFKVELIAIHEKVRMDQGADSDDEGAM
ncbi:hypothetical protein H310_05286 [Aphanomyces invadans]|uniref:peptidylprolyl isomerase n=1 Tax=Aphanomyces invadans TaxID=157072 RepID=A0A024U943_9STRA|nr:hypothetical protein H310_05286 [Aphanomyces invadans]ETW02799.1 hypothetical protein H310_05286 [Aphanomyces invadans]|eukprot:XP_008868183.1 hypothetical protein H310_05286 [Aphanomyces invadans]